MYEFDDSGLRHDTDAAWQQQQNNLRAKAQAVHKEPEWALPWAIGFILAVCTSFVMFFNLQSARNDLEAYKAAHPAEMLMQADLPPVNSCEMLESKYLAIEGPRGHDGVIIYACRLDFTTWLRGSVR